jgi:hypothetical protein
MEGFIPFMNAIALAIALIALMVGLCLMPWQVLLILLIGGLVASQRLMVASSPQSTESSRPKSATDPIAPTSSSAADANTQSEAATAVLEIQAVDADQANANPHEAMLIYRGARYKPSTASSDAIADKKTEWSGKYRGGIWKGRR